MKSLVASSTNATPPSERDFDTAFTIADENKSGNIDVFEFIRIYQLVEAGEVSGLAEKVLGGSFFFGGSKRRKSRAAFRGAGGRAGGG